MPILNLAEEIARYLPRGGDSGANSTAGSVAAGSALGVAGGILGGLLGGGRNDRDRGPLKTVVFIRMTSAPVDEVPLCSAQRHDAALAGAQRQCAVAERHVERAAPDDDRLGGVGMTVPAPLAAALTRTSRTSTPPSTVWASLAALGEPFEDRAEVQNVVHQPPLASHRSAN